MGFLSARLGCLDVLVFSVEAATVLLLSNDFFEHGLLAVLVLETAAVELGGTFNNGADLGESRNIALGVVLFVVALGIEDATHLEELQISTQLWSQVGLGHVEPL